LEISFFVALDFVASNGYTGKDIREIFFASVKDKGILEKNQYNVE